MIRSIRHKGLKRFYEDDDRRGIRADLMDTVQEILTLLDDAAKPEDLAHPLKGERKGYWAMTVRANWRIVFRFDDGDAFDVDLVDYH